MKKKGEEYHVDYVNRHYEEFIKALKRECVQEFIEETYVYNKMMDKPRVIVNRITKQEFKITVN